MYSFIICLIALVLGYIIYGKFVDKLFGPLPTRKTPAIANNDSVDFVPLPTWKVFMIQFLNIAGTGPIFGAIMGAKFGPSCFIWIVLGSIFAGGVHDYLSGMMSVRSEGKSVPSLVDKYFGKGFRTVVLVFTVILMLLTGTVFVYSPALIINNMVSVSSDSFYSIMFWVTLIFIYYIVATILPIDKLIGKVYPVFAFCLIFMAIALCAGLFIKWPAIPEIWSGLQNRGPSVGLNGQPIIPCLFITVACGAISGFHSTQSPIMARCIENEKYGRPVFYGAMITEGAIALVWAAISSWFFFDGGMQSVGLESAQAPEVVTSVSESWLGVIGGVLAIIGVVAAPITSGDTSFRSARLIIADVLHLEQKTIGKRFLIAVPMFVAASVLLAYNISDANGFNVMWRYFGLANQTLATFVLWIGTAYFMKEKKNLSFLMSMIPACFMTGICITFFCIDKTCLGLPASFAPWIFGSITTILSVVTTGLILRRRRSLRSRRHLPHH